MLELFKKLIEVQDGDLNYLDNFLQLWEVGGVEALLWLQKNERKVTGKTIIYACYRITKEKLNLTAVNFTMNFGLDLKSCGFTYNGVKVKSLYSLTRLIEVEV